MVSLHNLKKNLKPYVKRWGSKWGKHKKKKCTQKQKIKQKQLKNKDLWDAKIKKNGEKKLIRK